jgi:hypothetical protein
MIAVLARLARAACSLQLGRSSKKYNYGNKEIEIFIAGSLWPGTPFVARAGR